MVEVTQADREAAADAYHTCYEDVLNSAWMDALIAGKHDDDPLVRAFAANRLAERERCARVAEDWTMDWTRESAHVPSDIAQAIRITQ